MESLIKENKIVFGGSNIKIEEIDHTSKYYENNSIT